MPSSEEGHNPRDRQRTHSLSSQDTHAAATRPARGRCAARRTGHPPPSPSLVTLLLPLARRSAESRVAQACAAARCPVSGCGRVPPQWGQAHAAPPPLARCPAGSLVRRLASPGCALPVAHCANGCAWPAHVLQRRARLQPRPLSGPARELRSITQRSQLRVLTWRIVSSWGLGGRAVPLGAVREGRDLVHAQLCEVAKQEPKLRRSHRWRQSGCGTEGE